jgi:hypothetical protein
MASSLTTDTRTPSLGAGAPPTRTGIIFDANLSYQQWEAIGQRIANIADASAWWIGDWLLHGQWTYGRKYEAVIEVTGYKKQTLKNLAWVAGRYQLSRRRDNLTIGHHETVASLAPHEADHWLLLAERERYTVKDLRDHVNAARTRPLPEPKTEPNEPIAEAEIKDNGANAEGTTTITYEERARSANPATYTVTETNDLENRETRWPTTHTGTTEPAILETITLTIPETTADRWDKAAQKHGLTITNWLIHLANTNSSPDATT